MVKFGISEHPMSQFQLGLLFVSVLITVMIFGLFIFYISRKYPRERAKLDPIYKGTFISILLYIAFVITPAVFGFIEPETAKKATLWFIGITIALVAFYGFILPYFLRRPISTEKLFSRYVMPQIRELFGGENYQGIAYRPALVVTEVMPSTNNPYLRNIGSTASLMQVFLTQHIFGNRKTGNIFSILSVRDKFTGEDLKLHLNPPLSVINDLLGREISRSYKQQLEEYETEQPIIEKVK